MEKGLSALELIEKLKNEVSSTGEGGGNFANFLYFKKGEGVKKLRFISDLNEALVIKFHDKGKFENGKVNTEFSHPCLTLYGKECPTCKLDSKPKDMFLMTVYDYSNEFEPRRLLVEKYSKCSMIPFIDGVYGLLGTVTGKDYNVKILQAGTTNKSYEIRPIKDTEAFDKEVEKFTLEEALEEFKKDKFKFQLPKDVFFTDLPDLKDEPF